MGRNGRNSLPLPPVSKETLSNAPKPRVGGARAHGGERWSLWRIGASHLYHVPCEEVEQVSLSKTRTHGGSWRKKGGRAWQPLRENGCWRRGRLPWRPTIRRGSLPFLPRTVSMRRSP